MTQTMNDALTALLLYCQGTPRDEIAELIRDTAYGEHPLDPTTRRLLKAIFNLMPEPDNFTTPELAEAIKPHAPDIARIVLGTLDDLSAESTHTPGGIAPDGLGAPTSDPSNCPGFGEDCGALRGPDDDLCPDCTMARLDVESPRIPR